MNDEVDKREIMDPASPAPPDHIPREPLENADTSSNPVRPDVLTKGIVYLSDKDRSLLLKALKPKFLKYMRWTRNILFCQHFVRIYYADNAIVVCWNRHAKAVKYELHKAIAIQNVIMLGRGKIDTLVPSDYRIVDTVFDHKQEDYKNEVEACKQTKGPNSFRNRMSVQPILNHYQDDEVVDGEVYFYKICVYGTSDEYLCEYNAGPVCIDRKMLKKIKYRGRIQGRSAFDGCMLEILSIRGGLLYSMLTPDDESRDRWDSYLGSKKVDVTNLCLSKKEAVRITSLLFEDIGYFPYVDAVEALEKRLERALLSLKKGSA